MQLNLSRDWFNKSLEAEEGHNPTAGDLPYRTEALAIAPESSELTAAFGTLVQLWRIDQKMTQDRLAEVAGIDLDEVESIEADGTYKPEPQAVCSLAHVMKVPELKLLELSGNVTHHDPDFVEYSLAFAANAKQWQTLSKEQRRLLQQYLKYLSEH